MKLKLVRLISAYYPVSADIWKSWSVQLGDVLVRTFGHRNVEGKLNLLLAAEIALNTVPELTSDKLIVAPELPRKKAEQAIEVALSTISISKKVKRQISSAIPYIAFLPEDDEAKSWLESTEGISMKMKTLPICGVQFDIGHKELVNSLSDRFDGVILMAEALSHEHITGRFHELMRLFERAFQKNRNGLIKPLTQFLDRQYYTEAEIKKWVVDIRNPATHANKNRQFALESDIRPIIEPMLQAAFDVLFNKANWYDPSVARRNVFVPQTKVVPGETPLRIRQHHTGNIDFQLLDGFSAYPMDTSAGIDNLPNGYWAKGKGEMKSETFGMAVEKDL